MALVTSTMTAATTTMNDESVLKFKSGVDAKEEIDVEIKIEESLLQLFFVF